MTYFECLECSDNNMIWSLRSIEQVKAHCDSRHDGKQDMIIEVKFDG